MSIYLKREDLKTNPIQSQSNHALSQFEYARRRLRQMAQFTDFALKPLENDDLRRFNAAEKPNAFLA